jgi:hypothetical protein
MFHPNWPSSGVEVVIVKDSAARCNVDFFLLLYLPLVILVMQVTISPGLENRDYGRGDPLR